MFFDPKDSPHFVFFSIFRTPAISYVLSGAGNKQGCVECSIRCRPDLNHLSASWGRPVPWSVALGHPASINVLFYADELSTISFSFFSFSAEQTRIRFRYCVRIWQICVVTFKIVSNVHYNWDWFQDSCHDLTKSPANTNFIQYIVDCVHFSWDCNHAQDFFREENLGS